MPPTEPPILTIREALSGVKCRVVCPLCAQVVSGRTFLRHLMRRHKGAMHRSTPGYRDADGWLLEWDVCGCGWNSSIMDRGAKKQRTFWNPSREYRQHLLDQADIEEHLRAAATMVAWAAWAESQEQQEEAYSNPWDGL